MKEQLVDDDLVRRFLLGQVSPQQDQAQITQRLQWTRLTEDHEVEQAVVRAGAGGEGKVQGVARQVE